MTHFFAEPFEHYPSEIASRIAPIISGKLLYLLNAKIPEAGR
jgi:hypothetical protein